MVAPRKLTDADKAVDFTQVIQGHCGQRVKQIFTCERTRLRRHPQLQIEAQEHIVRDQFDNLYVVFTANLFDGDIYAVTAWVGTERWCNGDKRLFLVKEWKKFPAFNDAMLTALQELAFISLGKANLAILKSRHAAKLTAIAANVSSNPKAA